MALGGSSIGASLGRTCKIPIHLLLTEANGPALTSECREQRTVGANLSTSPALSSQSSSIPEHDPDLRATIAYVPPMPTFNNFYHSGRRSTGAPCHHLEPPESDWPPSDLHRPPRAPRPSYSEEQKFFIMFSRIVKDHSWPEIEDRFAFVFGQRTKGGLTSVYYRIRKDWGLAEVLKGGPGSFAADCREVERRALNFSAEFLTQIGFLIAR